MCTFHRCALIAKESLTREAMDIFKQTVFDLMLARPNLINRFFSNPSGASNLFFLGRRRDKPQTQINYLDKQNTVFFCLFT